MRDLIHDAVKQSAGRWQAAIRRLNGQVVWKSARICHAKRSALVEAYEELQFVLQRGPETVEDGVCTECGRDYSDEPQLRRCPSDDCPSHWEAVGLMREDA